jgi:subtilisin family serine protease
MKPYDPHASHAPAPPASDLLRVAVTFPSAEGAGPVKFGARISSGSASSFAPDPRDVDRALDVLKGRGFSVSRKGKLTVSMRCSRADYETLFGTTLEVFDSPSAAQAQHFYFPGKQAHWKPQADIVPLIDDAYIQWPHIFMAAKKKSATSGSAKPKPKAKAKTMAGGVGGGPNLGYHYLSVPNGVRQLLNVDPVHKAKITGKGVRVVMIDSGFDQSRAWFKPYRARSSIVLAPGASSRRTDPNGHGTGESANVFSVAPDCTFIGVKVDNDASPDQGASILEGFQEALTHNPRVITISMGYDLRSDNDKPLAKLPNSLVPLEAEIQAAIAAGIVVVFASGNGHYSFPGQMPGVISAGGVYVDAAGRAQASNYASAFPSAIYAGRIVPDFCGLVGMAPDATYIRLPIPKGCEIDRDMSATDKTSATDGWGVFSGTSAAAPQVAGVCALLLQKNPGLKPSEVKAVLRSTARDVSVGRASATSDPAGRGGVKASSGLDGATGAGWIDAAAALRQV